MSIPRIVIRLSLCLACSSAYAADDKTLTIQGWPATLDKPVWEQAAGDAVFSTLVCPALTRLNLSKNRSEPFLAKDVAVSGNTWRVSLDPDARLWDGQSIAKSGKAIAAFLKNQLPAHVKRTFGGKVAVPKARYGTSSPDTVTISWERTPVFGPYILNGLPLKLKAKSGHWQCAGEYKPAGKGTRQSLTLVPAHSSTQAKFARIELTPPTAQSKRPKLASGSAHLGFSFADAYAGNPWQRMSDKNIRCKNALPTSVITAIMWNPNGRYTDDKVFRGAMTHLTPRGALLRSGGGDLGELLSAPIPRHHPGYHRRVFVRSFSYPKAVKILEKLGYKRPIHDQLRLLPDGKTPMSLTLGTLSPEGSLHKILADTYMSVGIDLKFKRIKDPKTLSTSQRKGLDGILMGLKLPYPSGNIMPLLTSESPFGAGYATLGKHFVPYLRSLTKEKPDFGALRTAHIAMYKEEPMSVLLQYNQCLTVSGKTIALRKSPDIKDPAWLKKLIF